MDLKIFEYDNSLTDFRKDIEDRALNYKNKKRELVGDDGNLSDFANAANYLKSPECYCWYYWYRTK